MAVVNLGTEVNCSKLSPLTWATFLCVSASTGSWFAPGTLAWPRSSPPWHIARGKGVCPPNTLRSSAGRDRVQGQPAKKRVGTGSRLLSHLSVSANHSCQVVEALPWAEEVSKVVVVAIDQALLFPVAVKPAHHPCHVLPTKDRCWNCRTCISAEENITLCTKQVTTHSISFPS